MAYYSLISDKVCFSGFYDFSNEPPVELKPYLKATQYPFQYAAPLSIVQITVDDTSEHLFRYVTFVSNAMIYFSFSENELHQIVFDFIFPYQHNNYEFSYVLDGECHYLIDGKNYVFQRNDCYLQSPYVIKCEDYTTNYSLISIYVTPDLMNELCPNVSQYGDYALFHFLKEYSASRYHLTPKDLLEGIMSTCLYLDEPGMNYLLKGYLGKIFHVLGQHPFYLIHPYSCEKQSFLFQQLTEILQETYGRVDRATLEKQLHYSGDYLNTFIKRYTQMTLTELKNSYALQHASELLMNTQMTIDEICEKLHFTDRTYFYKIFRQKYGVTPKKYRDRN